jgi:lactoylglutathione lyase
MIPVQDLFETHLTVSNLKQSMAFYGDKLGLKLARVFKERNVAFYWMKETGDAMLGLWETGSSPQRMNLHIAFKVDLNDLLAAPAKLQAAGITPLDFEGRPTHEPVVLAWMPAAAVYFSDPDGNLLEFLTMLPESPNADLGVILWTEWKRLTSTSPARK